MNFLQLRSRQAVFSIFIATTLLLSPTIQVFAQPTSPTPAVPEEMAATPPSDTTAPNFASITAISVEPTSMTVAWTTDELSTGYVEYGPTSAYGMKTGETVAASLVHIELITGLTTDTTYHYRIYTIDEAGNHRYSADKTVVTAKEIEIVDNQPPTLTSFALSHITATGAQVSITTDEESTATLEYGLTPETTSKSLSSSEFSVSHDFSLSSLKPETVYHVRVVVQNAAGNVQKKYDEIITTPGAAITEPLLEPKPEPIPEPVPIPSLSVTSTSPTTTSTVTKPIIETPPTVTEPPVSDTLPLMILVQEVTLLTTSTAKIVWTTNKPSHGTISYGTTNQYGQAIHATTEKNVHALLLTDLTPGTNYFYKIVAETTDGKQATVENQEFNTLRVAIPLADTIVISDVVVSNVGTSNAYVNWKTNKPAHSEVEYGVTTDYAHTTGIDSTTSTTHRMILSNLSSGMTYHFRIASRDAFGDLTLYQNLTFTTAQKIPTISLRSTGSGTSTPPLASISVHDLRVIRQTPTSLIVAWTVPTVIDVTSDRFFYDLRYSQAMITINSFPRLPQAQPILFQPNRTEMTGNTARYTYTGLRPFTTYHMAFRIHEPDGQLSHLSNIISSKTLTAQKNQKNPEAIKGPPPTPPQLIKMHALNSQVTFLWRLSSNQTIEKTVIVKKNGSYPKNPQDGEIVYVGNGKTFTDTNLDNGIVHLYALFHQGPYGRFSAPLKLRAIPRMENTQTQLHAMAFVSDPTPLFRFPRDLRRGDRALSVTRLQTLLSEQTNLYPERLVTGYFGPRTQTAIKKFQKKYNLPESGRADEATRKKLEKISIMSHS